ncbi:ornithine cyclodeaminase family protein [Acidovorax sp. CCYZU-2555]|uniref:ornithine cyclodeaminase family protein n=1 Tax=Acidovorax sp. CCYZU-2555 TaxID=2835042 RepID=UPI001BD12DD3|nr:ornithine cyclodeaminase family protein [Acidovorax sp. CCYZU-2555]MBS7777389.1 ornithine cyclodeaminase family protein [Acidovorax sp. CCYZU-2555]
MSEIFIDDQQVAKAVSMREAIEAMRLAFLDMGRGGSSIQDRVRIHAGGNSLSMMGGIHGADKVMGAKVYPTVGGQFDFVINLFSAETGKLLRVVQGNELTRLRTAAVTRVVADACVRKSHVALAIFGSGIQAQAHAEAFCADGFATEVLVCARDDAEAFARSVQQLYGVPARVVDAATAASQADIVITATRSSTALFDGAALRPGTFVAAIGSSKPSAREIDDVVLARAGVVVVESRAQALREGGDLVMAADQQALGSKVIELGPLLVDPGLLQGAAGDITVYKSVGVGIEDVALAQLVHRNLPRA